MRFKFCILFDLENFVLFYNIYFLSVLNCSIFTEYISKTHHTINQYYQINLTINYFSSKILLSVYLFCSSCFHNTSNLKFYRCHACTLCFNRNIFNSARSALNSYFCILFDLENFVLFYNIYFYQF